MKTSTNGNNNFLQNKKSIELLKNTGIIGIGKIGTYIISFLLLPLYTTYLAPSSYGSIELVNNYVSLLTTIITLQIEQGCFRYLIENEKESVQWNQIVAASFLGMVIQVIIGSFVIVGVSIVFHINYVFFILINTITNSILVLLQQISRGCGENTNFALSGLLVTVVAMVCSCVNVIIWKLDIQGVLIASFFSYLVAIIYLVIKNQITVRIMEFRWNVYYKLLKYSIPLIVNSVSWWIFNVSDRTIINVIMGLDYTGIYSIANKFPGIGMSLYSIFNMAWTETVSRYINKENEQRDFLMSIMTRVYGLFSTLVFASIAIMPLIFPVFVNQKYFDAYNQIPILFFSVLAYGVSAMYGALYIALKRTKRIAVTSFLAAFINIFINVVGIRKMGLYAASISTFVAYLGLAICRGKDIERSLGAYINKKIVFVSMVSAIVIIFLFYQKNVWSVGVNILFVCIYGLAVNKESICYLIKKVK